MENRKLERIKNGREVLGGVCLGLGEYFNTDPLLFRVAFVLLFIFPVPSIIPYLILWAVLPKKNSISSPEFAAQTESLELEKQNSNNIMSNSQKNGGLIGGATLIILGIIFSVKEYADINLFHYIGKAWPLFFIGLGLWMILRDKKENNDTY